MLCRSGRNVDGYENEACLRFKSVQVELLLNTTHNLEALAERLVPLPSDTEGEASAGHVGWCLRTNVSQEAALDEHVAELRRRLSDMEATVQELGRRNHAILVVTIVDTTPAGFELKPEHLRWLGRMGIQVDVTFQFLPDEEESWDDEEQE
jgi:hypothetical protein